MKINAKISILFANDGLSIEVYDEQARVEFLSIRLNKKQACEAMSRVAHTECTAEVRGLDKVGKVREAQRLEFEMPGNVSWQKSKEVAAETAKKLCPPGWTVSTYFGSKDSFFKRDGKDYAQTTIYRWVEG